LELRKTALYKTALSPWFAKGLVQKVFNTGNNKLFHDMRQGMLKQYYHRPKSGITMPGVNAVSNIQFKTPSRRADTVNKMLYENPIRQNVYSDPNKQDALLAAMSSKNPAVTKRFLQMKQKAEAANLSNYKAMGELKGLKSKNREMQSALFVPVADPKLYLNMQRQSKPSVPVGGRNHVLALSGRDTNALSVLPPEVIARKTLLNKPVVSKSNSDNSVLSRYPEDYVPMNYSKETMQKQVDSLMRQEYPQAFGQGHGKAYVARQGGNLDVTDPDTKGMFIAVGNQPVLMPKLLSRSQFFNPQINKEFKQISEDWAKAGRVMTKKDRNSFYNDYVARRLHTGAHERWHNVHNHGVLKQQFEQRYPNAAIRNGVTEILADNSAYALTRKIMPPSVYADNYARSGSQFGQYQIDNIDRFLSGNFDIAQTRLAIQDLLKARHPVTGERMRLEPKVREHLKEVYAKLY
jgi:hypothetical protein